MEPTEEHLAILEKRVADLEELVKLLMTLKSMKTDLSMFSCEPIKLGTTD